MKLAGRALLWLSPLLLVGATCVTNVSQHGAAGPWTGELVNTGDQTASAAAATARILDAAGQEVYPGRVGVIACPSKLLPGERAAFELFGDSPDYPAPSIPLASAKLPLRAEFDALAHEVVSSGPARGDGLLVTLIARDAKTKVAHVRLTNNHSDGYYQQLTVCGILRTGDGSVVSVGRGDGPMPDPLFPGKSIDIDVQFDVMREGDLRFYAVGLLAAPYADCCPLGPSTWHSVNTGPFSVLLPPGWLYEPAQGIDSFVGAFSGDSITLNFDYGMYSGAPPDIGDPAFAAHDETIGGFTVRLYSPRIGDAGQTGMYVRTADVSQPFGYPVALSLAGAGLSPAQQQVAMQIFRSLRIRL
jgi:hypothetical protein